jgi:predicted signal transduction protein with EAL and GGDEF domain
MPLTTEGEAGVIAARLRMALRSQLPGDGEVTVSIGVAACGEDVVTHSDLVEKADAALYQAKRSGKDRVVVAAGDSAADGAGDSATDGLRASRSEERPLPDADPW